MTDSESSEVFRGADMHYRVVAPHFVAGISVAHDGAITAAAPIIRWALDRQFSWFRGYAERKGWSVDHLGCVVTSTPPEERAGKQKDWW